MRQPVEELEGKDEAIGLLRIEAQVQVVACRLYGQPLQSRVELRPDARLLQRVVARRERGELDADSVAALRPGVMRSRASARTPHRVDGVGVGALVALGVGGGARALAQHVERAQPAVLVRALERVLDGAAEHELLAHDADRARHRRADHRLAQPTGEALEEAGGVAAGVVVGADDRAGEHQAPGRGVHEGAVAAAEVARPVGAADLLGDQGVARGAVGRCAAGTRRGTSAPGPRACPG